MQDMQVIIEIEGNDAVEEATILNDWLHESRINEVKTIKQEEMPPKPGEQGPTLLAILTVVLGSKAIVELVRSIHHYIDAQAQNKKSTVTVKLKGGSIKIESTNLPPLSELINLVKSQEGD